MSSTIQAAEATAVHEIAKKSLEPREMLILDEDGTPRTMLLCPNGEGGFLVLTQRQLFAQYRQRPDRREGTARVSDLESFVALTKRFADDHSAIFADTDPNAPSLLCVLDYHEKHSTGAPRFGRHRVLYAFPLAEEWTAWTSSNTKSMDQESFARWIEDRLVDVIDPSAAGEGAKQFASLLSCGFASASKLLELSRGLSVHVGRRVVNHANLATGESTVSFAEEHADSTGKQLKLPGAFLIGVPVFRGGALYQIPARLRYRVQAGSISWSYELHAARRVFDHAVQEACDKAKSETGLPLFLGTPEKAPEK